MKGFQQKPIPLRYLIAIVKQAYLTIFFSKNVDKINKIEKSKERSHVF